MTPRESGTPLDARTRQQLEPLFGHSFSDVRVHMDSGSDALAREVDAVAFTAREHLFFRDGAPAFDSPAGMHLLAHELAHVRQQACADPTSKTLASGPLRGAPNDQWEHAADDAARAVLSGEFVASPSLSGTPPAVQCYSAPDSDWWVKTVSDVGGTASNALSAVPVVGNVFSAEKAAAFGLAGLAGQALGDDNMRDAGYSAAEDNALNAIPYLGNARAATQAVHDAGATVGDFRGDAPATNRSAEDEWHGGGQKRFNEKLSDLLGAFF